jgi:iron-sulfur cluster repair protein YtfE (RIC family)
MRAGLPTDQLRREHEVALASMRQLRDACRESAEWGCRGRPAVAHDASGKHMEGVGAMLSQVRSMLLLHFRKEEEGLFPDVQQMVSEGAPAVDIIAGFFREQSDDDLKAHTLLRGRMTEMGELLASLRSSETRCEETAKQLQLKAESTHDLLARHADKENTVVFPMIERLLDKPQMAVVVGRIQAIEASHQAASRRE